MSVTSNTTECIPHFLSGVCVCATGITSKEEKQIKSIMHELGGKYSTNFTGLVTHLLVKRVGSPKHEVISSDDIYLHVVIYNLRWPSSRIFMP